MLHHLRKAAGKAAIGLLAAIAAAGFQSASAAEPARPAVATPGTIVATYHQKPSVAAALTFIETELSGDHLSSASRRMRLIGFMAGLVAADPAFVDRLAPLFRKLPGDQPMRLVRAIAYSGRPDWSLHAARLKNLWPEHASGIETISAKGGRPIPHLTDTKNVLVIDLAAGYWGATGNAAAIERIIAALPTHRMTQSAEQLLVGQAARWHLAAASRTDPAVRAVCMNALDGPHGEALREILDLPQHPGVRTRPGI